uniref:Complement C3/4/5 macroglobulin domain-containing protein n=1 Tax=Esox lucius TaxID=8010 RepID=A0AAY5KKN3_ESOLU
MVDLESVENMWVSNLLCLAAVAMVLTLPNVSDGAALYVLSAPNLLRVGSNENIFVESQDHPGGDLEVKIIVKNHPTQNKVLVSKSVDLNPANNFQALTQVVIPEGDHFSDDTKQKQYVVLQAQFPDHVLEKVVLVSFQSGYIFIQTDKTIYTPASIVYYRVFSMSPSLEPLTRDLFKDKEIADKKEIAVSVEIMTPENITIFREIVNPDKGVKSGQFKLPEIVSFGTWHVVTRFQSTPQKTFSSDFEVKEYVLPSFEVSLNRLGNKHFIGKQKILLRHGYVLHRWLMMLVKYCNLMKMSFSKLMTITPVGAGMSQLINIQCSLPY